MEHFNDQYSREKRMGIKEVAPLTTRKKIFMVVGFIAWVILFGLFGTFELHTYAS